MPATLHARHPPCPPPSMPATLHAQLHQDLKFDASSSLVCLFQLDPHLQRNTHPPTEAHTLCLPTSLPICTPCSMHALHTRTLHKRFPCTHKHTRTHTHIHTHARTHTRLACTRSPASQVLHRPLSASQRAGVAAVAARGRPSSAGSAIPDTGPLVLASPSLKLHHSSPHPRSVCCS